MITRRVEVIRQEVAYLDKVPERQIMETLEAGESLAEAVHTAIDGESDAISVDLRSKVARWYSAFALLDNAVQEARRRTECQSST